MLETVTLDTSAVKHNAADGTVQAELFDLSLLRFQQRDDVAEVFRKYNHKVGTCNLAQFTAADFQRVAAQRAQSATQLDCFIACMQVPYDMQKAWDARSRRFYGSRYDYKRNAVSSPTKQHRCCVLCSHGCRYWSIMHLAEWTNHAVKGQHLAS